MAQHRSGSTDLANFYLLTERIFAGRAYLRYIVAAAIVACGALVRWIFLWDIGSRAPYMTLYPAAMIATLICGFPAGILATFLSAMIASYFWIEPNMSLSVGKPVDRLSQIAFVLSCLLVTYVSALLRRTQMKAIESDALLKSLAERREIEELLRQSEERYRTVVESQTDAICRIRADGTFSFVNDCYCTFFGKSRDELVGKKWHPIAFPDDVPLIEVQLATLAPANPVVVIENRVISGSGEVRWMQFVNRGFFDAAGRMTEMQSVGRDINSLKEIEQALRRSDERLHMALTASKMGVWEWDLQANTFYCSPECYGIVGLQAFNGTFRDFAELLHPADTARARDSVARAVERKSSYTDELRVICPDGQLRRLLNQGRVTYDEKGVPLRLTGTVQDITERKQAEEDLREYARRLIETEEELRRKLAADLHDDIARDLTVLGMNLAMIGSNLVARERQDALIDRVEDAGRLVEGVSRTVRSIMAGLRPPVLDDYGLLAAIRWHGELFANRTGVTVNVQADEPFPRLTVARELALFRITQEALMNAAKHGNALATTVQLNVVDGRILFSVTDEGLGFTPGVHSHQREGTGWGLKIMRERAELVGGSFRVESAPGAGTMVIVELPLEASTDDGVAAVVEPPGDHAD